VLGVVPGLDLSIYNTPYIITDLVSAANLYGYGRFTRAIGELFRQSAPCIIAVAIYQESDLSAVFDYLKDIPYDILVPAGMIATPSNLALFGQFSYLRSQIGFPTITVMPADPSPGVAALTASPDGYNAGFNTLENALDVLGRNFVLTLDQVLINPNIPSQYQADAAPSVAGLMAKLTPAVSITNETLAGLNLLNPYDTSDAQALSNAGYTVLKYHIRNGVSPFYGVTATSNNPSSPIYSSDFHTLSTMRIANAVSRALRDLTVSFIGDPAPSNLTPLVVGVLDTLKSAGTILAYTYDITVQAVQSAVYITVSVLPPFETDFIQVSAQINLVL
jgi:hypothetical protein